MVGGIHCAGCVHKLESTLGRTPGVQKARVNLTTRRMVLQFDPALTTQADVFATAESIGYTLQPYDPALLESADRKAEHHLMLCMAVAGFASMNVMLLSVSLWAGWAEMTPITKAFMQWFSALIVLPTVVYAGQPFFKSAWQALRHGRVNMDVPISLAILLTSTLSFVDMLIGRGETYFESAAMLLFFLLVGRYLDMRARGRNRSAAEHLLKLQSQTVRRIGKKGTVEDIPPTQLAVGDIILVARGQRIGADGIIIEGTSTLDLSLLTGESLPQPASVGVHVYAGTLNGEASLHIRVTAVGEATTLARLAKLVEEATQAKNRYTRLADRVARLYAPVVHTLSLSTFCAWFFILHADFHTSILVAAAVLIVTCPCALALAVPAVQVALVSKLLRHGVILKAPDALERLTHVKTIVFDKTGTLTTGKLALCNTAPKAALALAAGMAATSQHPLSKALARACPTAKPLTETQEHPGQGLSVVHKGITYRLGNASFCKVPAHTPLPPMPEGATILWLSSTETHAKPVPFVLSDALKPSALEALPALRRMGLTPYLLSGDAPATVAAVGAALALPEGHILGGQTPQQKHDFLRALSTAGTPALMCGDGINDAPSLAAAHVGLTFASATDIAQTSADLILQNEDLRLIPQLMVWAHQGHRAVLLNFGLSFAYNLITVPAAMMGYITPLWAAAAMSASSLMVVSNALRLAR